jgi:hypothetical protein
MEFSSAFAIILPVLANSWISMTILDLSAAKMTFGPVGRRQLLRLVLFLLGGTLAPANAARADGSRTLIIPPNDGYGFEECLKPGSACGLVVADAWCKAHGFAGANGFGPAEEAAATMDDTARSSIEPGSLHVTCGDRVN